VGAAVLVAAAIIIIPEILYWPRDNPPTPTQLPNSESDANGVKTYTIDLNAPHAKAVQNAPNPAPTFAETPPARAPETPVGKSTKNAPSSAQESAPQAAASPATNTGATLERDQRLLQESTEQEKVVDKKPASSTDKAPPEKSIAAAAPSAKPESDKTTHPVGAGAWAVQVASFGVRATSERIAGELKAQGYPAFVTSFDAKGQTMYRVRVGPVADRAAADALLKKIKPLHPGAAVVPQ
jgi:DedD protein